MRYIFSLVKNSSDPLAVNVKTRHEPTCEKDRRNDSSHDQVRLYRNINHSRLWMRALEFLEASHLRVDPGEPGIRHENAGGQLERPVSVAEVKESTGGDSVNRGGGAAVEREHSGEYGPDEHYCFGPFSSLMS